MPDWFSMLLGAGVCAAVYLCIDSYRRWKSKQGPVKLMTCPSCGGTGRQDGNLFPEACPDCNGAGTVEAVPCPVPFPECHPKFDGDPEPCRVCGGEGGIPKKRQSWGLSSMCCGRKFSVADEYCSKCGRFLW